MPVLSGGEGSRPYMPICNTAAGQVAAGTKIHRIRCLQKE